MSQSSEEHVTFTEYTTDGHRVDLSLARVELPNGITIAVPVSSLGVVLRELRRIEH